MDISPYRPEVGLVGYMFETVAQAIILNIYYKYKNNISISVVLCRISFIITDFVEVDMGATIPILSVSEVYRCPVNCVQFRLS